MTKYTREGILEAARKAVNQTDRSLSRDEFIRVSGITKRHIQRVFPGGWLEIRKLLGLELLPGSKRFSDDELLREFHRVASDVGRNPTWQEFSNRAKISLAPYYDRMNGRMGTLKRYRQ